MELKEAKLFEPLKRYLKKRGYKVYTEVPLYSSPIDVMGVRDDLDIMIAFEMKTGFNKKVAYQAYIDRTFVDFSYAVAPTKPREDFIEACKKFQIGIIRIVDNECIKILEAKMNDKAFKEHFDFTNQEEGITAGVPCQKGVGPAQDCLRRIKQYLEKNIEAGWEEIYNNVGSHYENKESMGGSMRQWCGFSLINYRVKLKGE